MDASLLIPKTEELVVLLKELGYNHASFDSEFKVIETSNKSELLKGIVDGKRNKKKIIFIPKDEELLRFAIEKTEVDMILGVERVHPKESLHYIRSGLDQVLCKLAAEKKKIIAFSFNDILNSGDRAKLISRMMINIIICRKYGVKVYFGLFSKNKEEVRSVSDLFALWRVLGGRKKEELSWA
ncbi:hypothetical protein J4444_04020 [Candidatus Woesearchaeota archaeon]|nr:hypothetical protein [Candidatus Woesearchaeota archaeon]